MDPACVAHKRDGSPKGEEMSCEPEGVAQLQRLKD